MSAPGMWKTVDGREMRITEMDDNHLRNSMYYMYRKIVEFEERARNLGRVINREDQPRYREQIPPYYTSKLTELSQVAITRNMIPAATYTLATLMAVIQPLNDEVMARRARYAANNPAAAVPRTQPGRAPIPGLIRPAVQVTQAIRADSPPAVLSLYIDVVNSTNALVRDAEAIARRPVVKVDRNLSFDL